MTRTVLLGDICDIKIGRTPPRKQPQWFSESHGIKWVSIKDMGNTGKYISQTSEFLTADAIKKFNIPIIPAGTLLMSFKLTVGRLGFTEYDTCSNEAIAQLPIKDPDIVDKNYLYYYLKNFNFGSLSSTSSIATAVNSKTVKNISVNLPSLDQQKKIADILSSLDEKIKLNRRMNETLEQLGQALFRYYFVDNPAAAGWDIVSLTELCDRIASGGTPSTRNDDYYGGDIQWYSTKELKDNFVFCSEKTITGDGLNESSAKLFPVNTVMMAIYAAPTVGRLGILTQEAAFNQATCGLVAKPSVGYEFIYLYLLLSRSDLNNMANGAAQQNISVGKVRNFAVMKPDDQTILKFKEKIQPIFEKIKRNSEETITLTSMRDSLLPKLISGEIKV